MHTYTPVEEPHSPAQMKGLTRDETMLLLAQRQEAHARVTLVQSLCRLGRFEDALKVAGDPEQEWIKKLMIAERADDAARCNCEYMIDRADYTRNENAKPKFERGKNYLKQFRYWSPRYGKVVWQYVCFMCGHTNATADEDINVA